MFINTSSNVVIKNNGFTLNREAVFFAGATNNIVKDNGMWENELRGVMIRPTGSGVLSTGNEVFGNAITDNPSGTLVFGQPGNILKGNTISGSTVAAIDLTGGGATENLVKGNLLTSNAAGIKFGTGFTGNSFVDNTIQLNACGIQGPAAGNLFKGKVFSGNTADSCL